MNNLCLHFDKDDHCLTADEFIQVASSTKTIYANLTKDIFNNYFDSELLILAPEKGGVNIEFVINISSQTTAIATSASIAIGGGTLFLKFIESDFGKVFVKKLTGNDVVHYAEKSAELIKDLIEAIYKKPQHEIKQLIEELKQINNQIISLDKSLKAKSDLYSMCLSNKSIKNIGFNKSYNFEISRQEFQNHVSKDMIRHMPPDIMIQELIVTRPVTVESKAKWELKDKATNEKVNYSLADEDFKQKVLDGNMLKQTKNDDYLIAKVEYVKELKNGVEKNIDKKILEVYQFNDMHFATIPSDLELNKMVKKQVTKDQLSLWDQNNFNELEFAAEGEK